MDDYFASVQALFGAAGIQCCGLWNDDDSSFSCTSLSTMPGSSEVITQVADGSCRTLVQVNDTLLSLESGHSCMLWQ